MAGIIKVDHKAVYENPLHIGLVYNGARSLLTEAEVVEWLPVRCHSRWVDVESTQFLLCSNQCRSATYSPHRPLDFLAESKRILHLGYSGVLTNFECLRCAGRVLTRESLRQGVKHSSRIVCTECNQEASTTPILNMQFQYKVCCCYTVFEYAPDFQFKEWHV